MKNLTFITGNPHKANVLARNLGVPLGHRKLELDELQSLDLREIVEHKARQAYSAVRTPVLIEDVGLTFHALGKLPGPFVKWFLQELSCQQVCDLLEPSADRSATAAVCCCVFDGTDMRFFDGRLEGRVSTAPHGKHGFGFDPIFIPAGSERTYAEMDEAELQRFGLRRTTVFPQLREFLTGQPNGL